MSWLSKFSFFVKSLFRKQRLDAQLSEEIQSHVDMATEANVAAGMSPEEARYAALREFGNVASVHERARDERGWVWLEQTIQDLHYAARKLGRSPGFALVATLTFALGIGANIGAFTIVNALMLRSLPVNDPGRLVIVSHAGRGATDKAAKEMFPFPAYLQFRESARSWDSLAAFNSGSRMMVARSMGSNEGESVETSMVSDNFFSTLGISAAYGRLLTSTDEDPTGTGSAAVLGYSFWERRFGADPGVLGKTILIDNALFTIVGIAPAGFSGVEMGLSVDLWTPLAFPARLKQDETNVRLKIIGRLRSGASQATAQSELDVMYQSRLAGLAGLSAEKARILAGAIVVKSGAAGYDRAIGPFKAQLGILCAIVSLVLLVASANVSSLLIARWSVQEKELAVRSALGAGRGRLVRQLLTESLLLAAGGGAIGILCARWTANLLAANLFSGIVLNLAVDGHLLAFTAIMSIGTGILVGLFPALGFSRGGLHDAFNRPAQGAGDHSRHRLGKVLVVAQIALSVCLVSGAGLFVRTLENFEDLDLGYNRRDVLGFQLQNTKFATNRDLHLSGELIDKLEALHGVQSATWSFPAPLLGGSRSPFTVEGYVPGPGEEMTLSISYVGPQFFQTLGIPLVHGRGFESNEIFGVDGKTGAPVAVISEALAKKYFGEADPLERFITLTLPGMDMPPLRIVGVARDTVFQSLREKVFKLYTPWKSSGRGPAAAYQVRTVGDARVLAPTLREAIRHIDAGAFIVGLRTLDEFASVQYAQERSIARVASGFSSIALGLAAVGLYGLLAGGVARRTREIGIRMALGAQRSGVLALVLRQGLILAFVGCTIGIGGAMGLVGLVKNRLFGVTTTDPLNLIVTIGLLQGVTLVACCLPAWRASKVDPAVALRAE